MADVALVFDVLDDREQNAGVTLPEKNAFDVGDGIPRHEILDLAVIIGEHDHGNIQPGLLDLARQLSCVHIADGQIGDDQIEARLRTRQFHRFRAAGDMSNPGELPQVEFERFVDEQLVEAAILAQNKRIVEAGDKQDVVHFEGHQVLEAFEALFRVHHGLGDAADAHGDILVVLRSRGRLAQQAKQIHDSIKSIPMACLSLLVEVTQATRRGDPVVRSSLGTVSEVTDSW